MNFEEQANLTTCDTCRYIAEQGGTATALDAYGVLKRTQESLRARVEELESMPSSPEEERSREAWRVIACTAQERVAELEAERVASQELVETIEDALSNGLTKRAKIVNALSKWRRTRDQAALVVALQEEK